LGKINEWGTEYHTIKSNNFGTSKLRHIRKPLSLNITTTTLKMKNLPTILLLVVTITIPYAAPLPIFREDEVSFQQLSLLMMPRPPYNEETTQEGDGQHTIRDDPLAAEVMGTKMRPPLPWPLYNKEKNTQQGELSNDTQNKLNEYLSTCAHDLRQLIVISLKSDRKFGIPNPELESMLKIVTHVTDPEGNAIKGENILKRVAKFFFAIFPPPEFGVDELAVEQQWKSKMLRDLLRKFSLFLPLNKDTVMKVLQETFIGLIDHFEIKNLVHFVKAISAGCSGVFALIFDHFNGSERLASP
jgi:hypothetical protein